MDKKKYQKSLWEKAYVNNNILKFYQYIENKKLKYFQEFKEFQKKINSWEQKHK